MMKVLIRVYNEDRTAFTELNPEWIGRFHGISFREVPSISKDGPIVNAFGDLRVDQIYLHAGDTTEGTLVLYCDQVEKKP